MTAIRTDRGPLPGFLLGVVLLPLLPSWLGLLGGWHWRLDLLAHFRWQYLFIGVLVLAWAVWSRQRPVIYAALLTCLLNAALIGRLAWPVQLVSVGPATNAAIRVVSFNVLSSNPHKQRVVEYLRTSGADAIFLMEVTAEWMGALQSLRDEYPHVVALPRPDNFGVALFSRIPLAAAELLDIGNTGLPTVAARLSVQSRELVLIGTHPLPPVGADNAGSGQRQLTALAEYVSQVPQPVLLVGDLNATPWSAGMRRLTARNLQFRSRQAPWKPTWRVRTPFAIPIDHALCSEPLHIAGREVGPDLGSDHRPLAVTVAWSAQPG